MIWAETKVRQRDEKTAINHIFVQSEVTAAYVAALLLGRENTTPQRWDYYPELFANEKKEYEERSRKTALEAYKEKRKAYVEEYNKRRRGE